MRTVAILLPLALLFPIRANGDSRPPEVRTESGAILPVKNALEEIEASDEDNSVVPLRPQPLPKKISAEESGAFLKAYSDMTVGAYDRFLTDYPESRLAARAKGNRAFLRLTSEHAPQAAYERMTEEYPQSDYIEDARETVKLLGLRETTSMKRICFYVYIEGESLRANTMKRRFLKDAKDRLEPQGIEVVSMKTSDDPVMTTCDGVLRGRFAEKTQGTWFEINRNRKLTGTTAKGTTFVYDFELRHQKTNALVWKDLIETNPASFVSSLHRRVWAYTLWDNSNKAFWISQYTPRVSWQTSAAVTKGEEIEGPFRSVASMNGTVAVAGESGRLEIFRLGLDGSLVYSKSIKGAGKRYQFDGLSIEGGKAFLYGHDGLMIFDVNDPDQPKIEAYFDNNRIGVVNGVFNGKGHTLVATDRGLIALATNSWVGQTVWLRPFQDVELFGPRIYLLTRKYLFVTTPELLGKKTVLAEIEMTDPEAKIRKVAAGGRWVYLVGSKKIEAYRTNDDESLEHKMDIPKEETGYVTDIRATKDRLYILSPRGLQIYRVDANAGPVHLADVNTTGKTALTVHGPFGYVAGGGQLEKVNLAPF